MGMEIDYLFAVGLFVTIFAFAVLFTSHNVMGQKDEITLSIASERADLVMNRMFSGELVSPMYKLYVYGQANGSDELVVINLNNYGKNDPNSAVVYDGEQYYNYSVAVNNIAFPASTRLFTVYFDDDSNFPSKNYAVNGTNKIVEKIYGPEQINVVQYKLMQSMTNENYSDIQYHISVKDDRTLLEYGPEPRGAVVVRKRPVLIQNIDGMLTEGWLIVKAWGDV
ncbi:MAG: hypothetical protein V1870_00580 [Candidatus Aenigmatarchaeota archaeon]